MYNIKYKICYVMFFLLLAEIIHHYIKYKNRNSFTSKFNKENCNKEGFTSLSANVNYNELPSLTNITKSYPMIIDNIGYKPMSMLQPIVITTKLKTLKNGKLPLLGYYRDNLSVSIIPSIIIRKKVLPVNLVNYNTSVELLENINSNKCDLGIIRDMDVLNLDSNKVKPFVIIPMFYETLYLLSSNKIKDLNHFQQINNLTRKIKIYTNKNDELILNKIISITNIERSNIEIYSYENINKSAMEFILNPEGLFFICCHFKNSILQNLLNSIECLTLDYIPTYKSMLEIGNYSYKNPVNENSLNLLLKNVTNKLEVIIGISTFKFNNVLFHNLSKNKLKNRNNSQNYNTYSIRSSLYISRNNLLTFTNEQLQLLASNMIKWYQTIEMEINKWNNLLDINNDDNKSFKLNYISCIDSKLEIESNMKNEMIKLNYILIK